MKLKLMLAAAVILALPLAAQAQKKPTKADADKVVKLISADKAKTKIYCDLAKLGDEAQQADEKKDTKKAEEIGQKMDAMGKQLGPEYAAAGIQRRDRAARVCSRSAGERLQGTQCFASRRLTCDGQDA